MSRLQWDAPAKQHHHSLPADRTLRQHVAYLHTQGLSWREIGKSLGGDPIEWATVRRAAVYKPRKREKAYKTPERAHVTASTKLSPREWQRVARAYNVPVEALRQARAAGMGVYEWIGKQNGGSPWK